MHFARTDVEKTAFTNALQSTIDHSAMIALCQKSRERAACRLILQPRYTDRLGLTAGMPVITLYAQEELS